MTTVTNQDLCSQGLAMKLRAGDILEWPAQQALAAGTGMIISVNATDVEWTQWSVDVRTHDGETVNFLLAETYLERVLPTVTNFAGRSIVVVKSQDTGKFSAHAAYDFLPKRCFPVAVVGDAGQIVNITGEPLPTSQLLEMFSKLVTDPTPVNLTDVVKMATGRVLVAIDVSGSADDSTIAAVFATFKSRPNCRVVEFSRTVVESNLATVSIPREGTEYQALHDYVAHLAVTPDHVIVITDGCGPHIAPANPDTWTWVLDGQYIDTWMMRGKHAMDTCVLKTDLSGKTPLSFNQVIANVDAIETILGDHQYGMSTPHILRLAAAVVDTIGTAGVYILGAHRAEIVRLVTVMNSHAKLSLSRKYSESTSDFWSDVLNDVNLAASRP